MLSATGLVTGTYKVYTGDASGNLSGASADNVTIVGLVDIDGNVYSTVVIVTQHWMAENLKVTKYRNGDNITNIDNNTAWYTNTSGAYGVYNNGIDESTYLNSYGRLYNWHAVDNSSSRYICPEGWHIPTKVEYDALTGYLGSEAGAKMKETGKAKLQVPLIRLDLIYRGFKEFTYFWNSTEVSSNNAYFSYTSYNRNTFQTGNSYKKYDFSVRFLED